MAEFSDFVNEISINLYSAASTINGNLLISPISILYASMLVYLGSNGTTKANFDSVFKFPSNQDTTVTVEPFTSALAKLKFNNPVQKPVDAGQSDFRSGMMELKLANAVFLQSGLNVNKHYVKAVVENLQASVSQKNFSTDAEGARKEINNWVADKTGRKIIDLIPQGSIDESTKAVLTNAVYFKAAWNELFDQDNTKKDDFKPLEGTTTKVDFMHLQENFNYFDDDQLNVQYLEIPYRFNKASLLVILPKRDRGLREVEAALNKDVLSRLAAGVQQNTPVDLTLPKFKVESSFDAKKLLQDIGINEVFTDSADLTGIVPEGGVLISQAFHKTFIEVDEKGTEAAAATAMLMVAMSAAVPIAPPTPIPFKADHPFIFAIRHNPTKLVLFIGRVENL